VCGVLYRVATENLKELSVKLSRLSVVLSAAALLLSTAAIARETNRASIHLDDKVVVNGKSLDSGSYTAQWEGSGPSVQVTLLHGKDIVTQFPAQLSEEATPNPQTGYGYTTDPDGSKELTSIYPSGKRFALRFGQNSAATQAGKNSSR
jgi:hypothetical protein